jgi:3-deoxy-7-phosphoheptulonate synthase
VVVIVKEEALRESERVRQELTAAGVRDVLAFRIGGAKVILANGADGELADRVRSASPTARVIFPVTTSPLADRQNFDSDTVVNVGRVEIGGIGFAVMAGPCAVESPEQLRDCAFAAKEGGASVLRGGAYKPRTSPHAFQGTGREGLKMLAQVSRETGLPSVSEVIDPRDVQEMAKHVDILQIGARNAQNFALLTEVGCTGCPVLLKRGFGCTVDEWLGAAEYILRTGNPNVILCERGIRTFESSTRFTLDLAAVAVVKRRSHLPVVVDPSHGTGHRDLVLPLALAAAAAGADGLIIDVHTDAASAKCDTDQALSGLQFRVLMDRLRAVLNALGRPQVPSAVALAYKPCRNPIFG